MAYEFYSYYRGEKGRKESEAEYRKLLEKRIDSKLVSRVDVVDGVEDPKTEEHFLFVEARERYKAVKLFDPRHHPASVKLPPAKVLTDPDDAMANYMYQKGAT